MAPFLFGERLGHTIFDLDQTAVYLEAALNFIAHIAYRDGIIMFVSRNPATCLMIEDLAKEVGEFAHTRRWMTDILTSPLNTFGGMTRLPELLIFLNTLDTVLEPHVGTRDAAKMLIPTVAVVDSNCNPNRITYPIPGNDDSMASIELYCKLFKEAIHMGKAERRRQQEKKDTAEATAKATAEATAEEESANVRESASS
ncbi:unnamed protein product [Cyprideis torosa]|uniref:Uncharacterized protein n=1 Tax=Cyprideis torosa TaxID=163714 RepID=A0A7R8ZTA4_9CRUS|nr:unnamed protein product [Cyprideis torosa]CAG0907297.1 unnamed protein product [Cyprideis torosa]